MDARLVNNDLPFLPSEIFYYHIFPYLDKQSWLTLRRTNRALNKLVTQYLFEYRPLPKSINKLFHEGNIHIETRLLLKYLRQPEYSINNRVNACLFVAKKNGVKLEVSPEQKALVCDDLAVGSAMRSISSHLMCPFVNGLTEPEGEKLVELLFARLATDVGSPYRINLVMELSPPKLKLKIIEYSWKYWNELLDKSMYPRTLGLLGKIVSHYSQERNIVLMNKLLQRLFNFANEYSFEKITPAFYEVASEILSVIFFVIKKLPRAKIENYLDDMLKQLQTKKIEVKFSALKVLSWLVDCLDTPEMNFNFTLIQKQALLTVLLNQFNAGGEVVVNAIINVIREMASKLNTEQANYVFFQIRQRYPLSNFKLPCLQILEAVAPKLGPVATAAAVVFFLMELEKSAAVWRLSAGENKTNENLYPLVKLALDLNPSLRSALAACQLTAKQLELIYQNTLANLRSNSSQLYLHGLRMARDFAVKFTMEQNQKTFHELTLKINSSDPGVVELTCYNLTAIFEVMGKGKPNVSALIDKMLPWLFLPYFLSGPFSVMLPELTQRQAKLILALALQNLAIEKEGSIRTRALTVIDLLCPHFNLDQKNFILDTIRQRLASDQMILREQAITLIRSMQMYFTLEQIDILLAWVDKSILGDDPIMQDLALRVISELAKRLQSKHMVLIVGVVHGLLEQNTLSRELNLRALATIENLNIVLNKDQCLKILPTILLKLDSEHESIKHAAFRVLNKLADHLSEEQSTIIISKVLSKLTNEKQYDVETMFCLMTHMIVNDKCRVQQLEKEELKSNIYVNVLQCFAVWYAQVKQMVAAECAGSGLVVKHGLFAEQKKMDVTAQELSKGYKK